MSEPFASFAFFSWLRRGMARTITAADPLGPGLPARQRFPLRVELNDDPALHADVDIELAGPGDVIGVHPSHVIRTDPPRGSLDFEANLFAQIELASADLPWRFSPAAPDASGRLRPWLALIVLAEGEFERLGPRDPLPVIKVHDAGKCLTPPDQLWAWAHVQASGRLDGEVLTALESRLLNAPETCLSRLVCPRRLRPLTGYLAFLVPAFEAGRRAGLGMDPGGDGSAPAWLAESGAVTLPVYYEWHFRTAPPGVDFETLARRLEPRVLDDRVGTRPMAVPPQALGVPAIEPALALGGALQTPTTQSSPWTDPPAFQEPLRRALNLAAARNGGASAPPLIVGPPIYGGAPVGAETVTATQGWLAEANLDPRHRAAAGLGARVVRANQEQYVAEAWRQVGEVEAVNEALQRAALGRAASLSLFQRAAIHADAASLIALAAPVHGRVRASPRTLRAELARTMLPSAALSGAFRRIARSGRPAARALGTVTHRVLERLGSGEIAAAGAPPERIPGANHPGDTTLPAEVEGLPAWLVPLLPSLPARLAVMAIALAVLGGIALMFGVGLLAIVLVAGAALAGMAYAFVLPRARALAAAMARSEEGLTAQRIVAVPPRPSFRLTAPGEFSEPSPTLGGEDSEDAAAFRALAAALQSRTGVESVVEPALPAADLGSARTRLLEALAPSTTIPRRIWGRIGRPIDVAIGIDPLGSLIAGPHLEQPLWEPLARISPDFLLPGLGHVPADSVALLRTNQDFVEAYLLGANTEMARELVWRGYPADIRATFFRQFWDVRSAVPSSLPPPASFREKLRDIVPIHDWSQAGELGTHSPRGDDGERLVLLVRGELLRRFPNASIFAVKARWDGVERRRDLDEAAGLKLPIFRGTLPPDVTFLGFELDPAEAPGSSNPAEDQGWFFVFQEHPSEPRFGLDFAAAPAGSAPATWSDLSWGHLASSESELEALQTVDVAAPRPHLPWPADGSGTPPAHWARSAADLAVITLQQPVRVAIHGSRMIA